MLTRQSIRQTAEVEAGRQSIGRFHVLGLKHVVSLHMALHRMSTNSHGLAEVTVLHSHNSQAHAQNGHEYVLQHGWLKELL
ncbi:Uncharacterized protein DAT39_000044 [Clarias magur]|uniref:Uncharacterized protein n=1 Tax=Clarias magur TaxID=1594786 RepID=A0A8J4XHH0_CLAMG|nr:Uncharacterized protein DAT39_000044 [Clarias magur]